MNETILKYIGILFSWGLALVWMVGLTLMFVIPVYACAVILEIIFKN